MPKEGGSANFFTTANMQQQSFDESKIGAGGRLAILYRA
jgi:hypothetical protein